MIDTILVVCEGNICRSPMAQALLAQRLPDVEVISAGTHALVGYGADPLATQLMSERGIDMDQHVATALEFAHVSAAQLILTMTRTQRELIEAKFPFARGKVYRLGEHDQLDVVDPYRRNRFIFEIATAQIEQGVSHWVGIIARMSY